MKTTFLISLTGLLLIASSSHAATVNQPVEREKVFRPGRSVARGNERSERVDRIRTGDLVHAGSGCPEGTMRAVFAPDSLSFTLLFDNFIAETVPGVKQTKDVMQCEALIPIEIPEGMQMEITRVDFRGFAALPHRGAWAQLHSVIQFRGVGGDLDRMNLRYQFMGPLMEDYEISADNVSEISPCGGTTTLRTMTQLRLVNNARHEATSITLDSIDGSSNAVYYVNWRKCQAQNRKPRPRIEQPTQPSRDSERDERGRPPRYERPR